MGTGVAIVGPAEGLLGELRVLRDKSILLLDSIPGSLSFDLGVVPDAHCVVSEVGVGRDELGAGVILPVEAFAHNKDVIALSEGVPVVGDGLEDNFRLVGDSLVS